MSDEQKTPTPEQVKAAIQPFSSPTVGGGDVHGGAGGLIIYDTEWPFIARNLRALFDAALTANPATVANRQDGNRALPFDRDTLGRMVREAWVRWAEMQPNPKPSWLVPYDDLAEADKEADRQIGEAVARWTLIGDASADAFAAAPNPPTVQPSGEWQAGIEAALKAVTKARVKIIHSSSVHFVDGVAEGHRRSEDAIRALRPASAPEDLYRHKKRGTTYRLLGIGKMQAEHWHMDDGFAGLGSCVDDAPVAIYRSESDGSLWVRPKDEFEDGRFEKASP